MDIEKYVWETNENELQGLIDAGYDIIYQDINLSVIYDELMNCFENDEMIKELFGYGLCGLLQVNDMHYWLMQA